AEEKEEGAPEEGKRQPAAEVSSVKVEAEGPESEKEGIAPVQEGAMASTPVPATPSVRRLARELGVDIYQVSGSGPGGRISMDDVKHYVRSGVSEQATTPKSAIPSLLPSLPQFEKWGEIR